MKNSILYAITLLALIFLGHKTFLAFNGFMLRPDKVITVRFKEVPPVIKLAGDIGVYYRGYKVGKAVCKHLSDDQKYILFCLEITYKNLNLPANIKIILKTQDIFGDRYFDLVYPDNPSETLMKHGDIVDGSAVYERVDKYLVENMENGKLSELISNLNYLTGSARTILDGKKTHLNKVSTEISGSVNDLAYITKELKGLLADPAVKNDIKKALAYTPGAIKSLNELLEQKELKNTIKQAPQLIEKTLTGIENISSELPNINENITEVNSNLEQVNTNLPNMNTTLSGTNSLLYTTNSELGCLNPKIPVIPESLILQADKTLRRYDCIGGALSETVSQNCLFFRFLFGNPGKPFKQCVCD